MTTRTVLKLFPAASSHGGALAAANPGSLQRMDYEEYVNRPKFVLHSASPGRTN